MRMDYKPNKASKALFKAILALKTEEECKMFLRDLLTENEIKEFANRWLVARMLDKKVNYLEIEKETGMSSTTIARISKWLTKGLGGYQLMLEKFKTMNINQETTKMHHNTA